MSHRIHYSDKTSLTTILQVALCKFCTSTRIFSTWSCIALVIKGYFWSSADQDIYTIRSLWKMRGMWTWGNNRRCLKRVWRARHQVQCRDWIKEERTRQLEVRARSTKFSLPWPNPLGDTLARETERGREGSSRVRKSGLFLGFFVCLATSTQANARLQNPKLSSYVTV